MLPDSVCLYLSAEDVKCNICSLCLYLSPKHVICNLFNVSLPVGRSREM